MKGPGQDGQKEFMAPAANRKAPQQLVCSFGRSLFASPPVRVHPESTWPAGENNWKQLAVSEGRGRADAIFLVDFLVFPDSRVGHM